MQSQVEDRVKVQFKVTKSLTGYPGHPEDYYVAITGSGIQLGNCNLNKAPPCRQVAYNLWVKNIWPSKNSEIKFKFLVVKRRNDTIEDIENTGARFLDVENKPLIVDVKFNKARFKAKVDERARPTKSCRKTLDKKLLNNKDHLNVYLNSRSQSKYELQANIKPVRKPLPPFTNRPKDEPIVTMNRLEDDMKLQTRKEWARPSKQSEERENTTQTTALTNSDMRTATMMNCTAQTKSNTTERTVKTRKEPRHRYTKTDMAEITQKHQASDTTRPIDPKSTPRPYIGRKLKILLAAAGVAAASFVGYYVFFKKK